MNQKLRFKSLELTEVSVRMFHMSWFFRNDKAFWNFAGIVNDKYDNVLASKLVQAIIALHRTQI